MFPLLKLNISSTLSILFVDTELLPLHDDFNVFSRQLTPYLSGKQHAYVVYTI